MTDEGDEFELSTGRRFYANACLLCPDENLDLKYGYDGSVVAGATSWDPADDDVAPFTPKERREIADYMIARWQRWASAVGTECTCHPSHWDNPCVRAHADGCPANR